MTKYDRCPFTQTAISGEKGLNSKIHCSEAKRTILDTWLEYFSEVQFMRILLHTSNEAPVCRVLSKIAGTEVKCKLQQQNVETQVSGPLIYSKSN